jgi:DNA-binding transcriptional ArsR family regulator
MAEEQLDAAFAALADPTRRSIVSRLAQGDATVSELAAPFAISLPAVSKHLKVLERSGLISRRRDAQFRPCHLETNTLDAAVDWIETHRRLWEERFEQLDTHLRSVLERERSGPSRETSGAAGRSAGRLDRELESGLGNEEARKNTVRKGGE